MMTSWRQDVHHWRILRDNVGAGIVDDVGGHAGRHQRVESLLAVGDERRHAADDERDIVATEVGCEDPRKNAVIVQEAGNVPPGITEGGENITQGQQTEVGVASRWVGNLVTGCKVNKLESGLFYHN